MHNYWSLVIDRQTENSHADKHTQCIEHYTIEFYLKTNIIHVDIGHKVIYRSFITFIEILFVLQSIVFYKPRMFTILLQNYQELGLGQRQACVRMY